MSEFFSIMLLPFLICLIFAGIHAYLGHHVIMRQVIFVDLALAQIAVLGAAIGLLFGLGIETAASYWLTLAFAMTGALILSLTRLKKQIVPQEAIIGVIYVFSAGLLVLILSRMGEGDRHIHQMLTGNILLVSKEEVIKCLILYSIIGVIHFIFRNKFFLISENKENTSTRNLMLYDIIFYSTFALVITSSVRIAGVFVVFSFLITPPLAAMILSSAIHARVILGWVIGFLGSALGLTASYLFDFPTGASIICSFGVVLILTIIYRILFARLR